MPYRKPKKVVSPYKKRSRSSGLARKVAVQAYKDRKKSVPGFKKKVLPASAPVHNLKGITSLKFKVGRVWSEGEGANEKHEFDVNLSFRPEEIVTDGQVSGQVMFINLKDEISVLLSNVSVPVKLICSRCLKQYSKKIMIDSAEREYLSRPPTHLDDIQDIFLIDMKDLTVDLYEMLRQEIILHFPFVSVCSSSCRGLCPVCGKDRNVDVCECRVSGENAVNRPFKDLKKLFKSK